MTGLTEAPTNTGAEFEDEDVVRAYVHRTDYPASLFGRLLELCAAGRSRLLDLGCGPGQFARVLAPHFAEVLAVDPSPAMLTLAQSMNGGWRPSINWVRAKAEDVRLDSPLDLIVAGASIHWMDPGRVFPKLARSLTPGGLMAVAGGDGPASAPWIEAWKSTMVDWVGRLGGVWDDPAFKARATAFQPWFDMEGQERFAATVVQAVDDLIDAEHSRATWARTKMGERAAEFDADLRAVVQSHAVNGQVEFETRSLLFWGRPRSTAR